MKYLQIPQEQKQGWQRLVFWLALEEWAVEHAPGSFFVWNVKPTVIFGRNQDMEAEVNIPYCLEHGIESAVLPKEGQRYWTLPLLHKERGHSSNCS